MTDDEAKAKRQELHEATVQRYMDKLGYPREYAEERATAMDAMMAHVFRKGGPIDKFFETE